MEKFLPKSVLEHGAYYSGHCRNASVARWCAETQKFYHWRHKFGTTFVEDIRHPDDDAVYDVFLARARVAGGPDGRAIPLPGDKKEA